MRSLDRIPGVRRLQSVGSDDSVFDMLILSGILLLGIVALFGRSLVTETAAIAYLLFFFSYTPYKYLVR